MVRNLKLLGLALMTLYAMGSMGASAASAASFTAEASPATIMGEELTSATLTVQGLEISCSEVNLHGQVSSASVSSLTVRPTYTGCKTSLGTSVSVTGFGHYGEEKTCSYVLHANGTSDLVCATGGEVTFDAGPCVVHIKPQLGRPKVTFTTGSVDNDHALTIHESIPVLHVNTTDGFLCPFPHSTTTTASMTATLKLWIGIGGTGFGITHDA